MYKYVRNQVSEARQCMRKTFNTEESRQAQMLGNKQALKWLVLLLVSNLFFVTHVYDTELLLNLG